MAVRFGWTLRQPSTSAAVENNLNRTKKSSNKSTNPLQQQQQQQQQPVFNPHSKHLDVWLANAIRGLETATSQDSSDQLDSPTPKGGSYGEPLSLPPNLVSVNNAPPPHARLLAVGFEITFACAWNSCQILIHQ